MEGSWKSTKTKTGTRGRVTKNLGRFKVSYEDDPHSKQKDRN